MIFYFTGTGNSLYAAQRLGRKLNEPLVSIADELNSAKPLTYDLAESEKVGFVFPVYAWQPPYMVIDFVKKITLNNYRNNYLFSLATCGDAEGFTTIIIKKALSRKGFKLQSGFTLAMPNNYMIGYNLDSQATVDKKLARAEEHLTEISSIIARGQENIYKTIVGTRPFLKSYIINRFFKRYAMNTKKFHATDDCTACGLCAEICNTNNISVEGKPFWGNHCVQCFACINRCPESAIQYGNHTQAKGRYVNPNCQFPV